MKQTPLCADMNERLGHLPVLAPAPFSAQHHRHHHTEVPRNNAAESWPVPLSTLVGLGFLQP